MGDTDTLNKVQSCISSTLNLSDCPPSFYSHMAGMIVE